MSMANPQLMPLLKAELDQYTQTFQIENGKSFNAKFRNEKFMEHMINIFKDLLEQDNVRISIAVLDLTFN